MHKDTLEELANSIKQQGIIQPLVARKQASGSYEIVTGERRWRAAQIAGLETVPTITKDLNNDEVAKISLIENLQREDLNSMDQARGLQRLQMEFNLSQQDLADAIGKSRPTVANILRLTRLSAVVQEMLEVGKIEMGHARALLSLDEEKQIAAAKEIVSKRLSTREAETLVSKEGGGGNLKKTKSKKDPNTIKLEKDLSEALGARVEIRQNKKGKGKLAINFANTEDLQRILDKIKS